MKCIVCGGESTEIFQKNILQKYPVKYYQCTTCNHLFTEKPYWLDEAYSSAITKSDIGLLDRNIVFREFFKIIFQEMGFNGSNKFIDFAGGYGVFTRLMRDKGWDFYWQDDFCENLYAKHFEAKDQKYTAATAFEVFEHSWEPFTLLNRLFGYSDIVFLSTEISNGQQDIQSWHYIEPLTGQHVSFASYQSLQKLADHYDAQYYHHMSFHCFVKNNAISFNPFAVFKRKGISRYYHALLRRLNKQIIPSKLASDHDYVRSILLSSNK